MDVMKVTPQVRKVYMHDICHYGAVERLVASVRQLALQHRTLLTMSFKLRPFQIHGVKTSLEL